MPHAARTTGVFRLNRFALSVSFAMAGLATVFHITPAYAQQAPAVRAWNLPVAPLEDTLSHIARESGYRLSLDPALIQGKQSPAILGNYTPIDAARQAVSGSGLELKLTESGTMTVQPTTRQQQTSLHSSTTTELSSIRVTAPGQATEGTGLYTARVGTTALPFALSPRDTPQSISVITNQLMEDRKLDSFLDVMKATPGVSFKQAESNRATLNARGLEINDFMIDGLPTTTIFDSRYTAGEVFNDMAIYDRVEIVRGSAGLSTGTGNPSAVVNLIRKKASSRTMKGSVSAEAGSWSRYGGMLDLSTPLTRTGDTRARFVANYRDKDSYIDLLKQKTKTFYGTIEHDLTNRTRIFAGVSRQEDRTKGAMWGGLPAWAGEQGGDWKPLPEWDKGKTTAADWTYWDVDHTNWFAGAEHTLENGWKAKLNYMNGKRNSTAKIILPFPHTAPNGDSNGALAAGIYGTRQEYEAANLQMDGDMSLFGHTHQLAFGVNYSSQDSSSYDRLAKENPRGNIYTWDGSKVPEPEFMENEMFARSDKEQKRTIYAAGRFSLLDPLKLIVGANYVDYRLTHTAKNGNQNRVDFNKLIPYAGATLDLNSWLSMYASYTRILQPQNVQDVNGNVLDPVSGNTKEIGLKGQFLDDRITASLALFKTVRQNQKVYDTSIAGEARYRASSDAESKGYEIEITGEILPGWQLSASYAKVTATYHNTINSVTHIDKNEKLDASLFPSKQFKLFTSYRMPGSWSGLTVGAGVSWQSEISQSNPAALIVGSFINMPLYKGVSTRQGSYAITDLMARYEFSDQLQVQLNINNVFDKKYYGISDDALQVYRQPPRSALLTLKYQF